MFFKQVQQNLIKEPPRPLAGGVLGNYESKIPSIPINIDDGGELDDLTEFKKREAVAQVEKSLRELDEKVSRPENSIVKESIEKSLYGKFA